MSNLIARLLAALFGKPVQSAPPTAKPTAPAAPKPALGPVPWMNWAHHEATDGVEEEPNHDNRGPVIRRYIQLAKCGQEGDPYCAIFANAAFEQGGIRGTRSALARSFETDPNFVKLSGPAYGAVTTFWRGSKSSGTGHVGFYTGQSATHVRTLGANQHDDCNESLFPINSATFGLVGFYWPKSQTLPKIGAIALNGQVASNTPVKVT